MKVNNVVNKTTTKLIFGLSLGIKNVRIIIPMVNVYKIKQTFR